MLTHSDLPRISEIVADTHKTYGVVPWEHWSQLSSEPQIKKHFVDLEYYLSSLREHDWAILKQKMVPQFKSKYQDRGWQLAFDLVNEAVAYNILGSRGFQVVSFVKESPKTQTPDLTAKKGNIIWACEVKTINKSENEIISRVQGLATSTFVDLDVNFFTKLEKLHYINSKATK